MRRPILSTIPLGIMVSAMVISPSVAADKADSEKARFVSTPPAGFEQLEAERELVLDVYYGGKRKGTARVALSGNRVEFIDARQALSFVDDAAPGTNLLPFLSQPLDANAARACGLSAPEGCGSLETESVGVILDEDRFRLDLFVAPGLRSRQAGDFNDFLAPPPPGASLISLIGGTVSGSSNAGHTGYRIQNRTIAALGSTRLRADLSYERGRGLSSDNLLVESDQGSLRFTAGQFWVPGSDLISRRKVIGAGLMSQFDTRRQREHFYGTPIEVFLNTAARVETIVDGQLVSSQILTAGNHLLDTSRWPAGSYDAIIRIHEPGRAPREERRFFSRDEALAPLERPTFQVFAGISSNGSDFKDGAPFVQGAFAYRFHEKFGARALVLGTNEKVIADLSGTMVTPLLNITAGALASSTGDAGAVVRGYSKAFHGVSASFDLRKMWTKGREPLLPISRGSGSYDQGALQSTSQDEFFQLTGQLSARVSAATVRFSGYFRGAAAGGNSYSLGPSIDWQIVRKNQFSLVAEGDARKTDFGFSSYAGVRLLVTDGSRSLSVRGGIEDAHSGSGRINGEVQGATFGGEGLNRWSANAALGTVDGSQYARLGGELRSALANARGEMLHDFGAGSQYSLTGETGLIVTTEGPAIAGGFIKDSALIVTAKGDRDEALDVYVDEAQVGTARAGEPLVVYLDPYREYQVQARPHKADLLSADFNPRQVAAFPGSVSHVNWDVKRLSIAFGRLVGQDGKPVGNAQIRGAHGVAESDENGYFQIETSLPEKFEVQHGASSCLISPPVGKATQDLMKWGDVLCR